MSALGMPISLRPEYAWSFLEREVAESYGRAMAMMDIALWTAEMDAEPWQR